MARSSEPAEPAHISRIRVTTDLKHLDRLAHRANTPAKLAVLDNRLTTVETVTFLARDRDPEVAEKARARLAEAGITVEPLPEKTGHWNSLKKDLARMERDRRQKRDEKQKARQLREAEIENTYGRLTYSGMFALREIRFYDKGYVYVSSKEWNKDGDFERLLSIEAKANVAKKTAPGRAAMALATFGTNLLTSGTVRGDVYLTIQTDHNTHVLHEQAIAALQVEATLKLEAAGRALLDHTRNGLQAETSAPAETAQGQEMTLRNRLHDLEAAHNDGLISDEEYSKIRQRLMDEY